MKRANSSFRLNDNHSNIRWNYSQWPSALLMIHSFRKLCYDFYITFFQIIMQIFIQCLHRVCSASFCAPSRFALAFKWARGERIRAFHTDCRCTSGSRILAIQAWNLPFVSDSPLNLLIFLNYYYLIYFADGLSVTFSFSLSSFAINVLLPLVLLLSFRPPAWPCCFVSIALFTDSYHGATALYSQGEESVFT